MAKLAGAARRRMSVSEEGGVASAVAAAVAGGGGARPEVTPLPGGVANWSFRLREGGRDFVLRIAAKAAARLGAGGQAEVAMQTLAAAAGLAPPIVLADPDGRFIVMPHAAGVSPGAAAMQDARLLRRIGAWLARLHALTPPAGLPAIDFGERAAGYLARVATARPDPFVEWLARELEGRRAALPAPARLAACHHDLHRRNLIDDGERILAIDWEYAGPGDAAADFAACVGYHDLGAQGFEALLEGYGGAQRAMRSRIDALAWIFDCLWYGWNAAAALDGLEPDRGEQARLAARLAH
jgi:aminoglycoside phosphotransferase (APT) family kinase protein